MANYGRSDSWSSTRAVNTLLAQVSRHTAGGSA